MKNLDLTSCRDDNLDLSLRNILKPVNKNHCCQRQRPAPSTPGYGFAVTVNFQPNERVLQRQCHCLEVPLAQSMFLLCFMTLPAAGANTKSKHRIFIKEYYCFTCKKAILTQEIGLSVHTKLHCFGGPKFITELWPD